MRNNTRPLPTAQYRPYPRWVYSNNHKRIGNKRNPFRFERFDMRQTYHDTRRYFERVDRGE